MSVTAVPLPLSMFGLARCLCLSAWQHVRTQFLPEHCSCQSTAPVKHQCDAKAVQGLTTLTFCDDQQYTSNNQQYTTSRFSNQAVSCMNGGHILQHQAVTHECTSCMHSKRCGRGSDVWPMFTLCSVGLPLNVKPTLAELAQTPS